MFSQIRLSVFYKSALIRSIRFLIFSLMIFTIVAEFFSGRFPRFTLSLFGMFIMGEIFFRFYLERLRPELKVRNNKDQPLLSCTKNALELYVSFESVTFLIQRLLRRPMVRYVLAKINISPEDIVLVNVEKSVLYQKALSLSQETGGNFVTTLDLLIAYLLFSEPKYKLLFAREIKPEDVLSFVTFIRHVVEKEEVREPIRVTFYGEGIGEALVTGWTPLTKQFTTDWTQTALRRKRLIRGREQEYRMLCESLSKKEDNNVVLVGHPGVGKDELLIALIHDSFQGVLPPVLNHKRLLELSVGVLLAGAGSQGELEERVNTIIEEVRHSGNVILFIPEFQNVLGSSEYKFSLVGSLLPHLRNGELPIVATMTETNFKTFLEHNPLMEVFNKVALEEPDEKTALLMLTEKSVVLERDYRCILSYQAVLAAIRFARQFLPDEVLPGSGVKLLSQAANAAVASRGKRTIVTAYDVEEEVEKKTNIAVGEPKQEEKELLLHLEERIHERVINQKEAVSAIAEAMRRIRSGVEFSHKPISFLFLGPTGVGKTETAKALSEIYFRGEDRMIRLDMSEYADEQGVRRLLGASPGEGTERGELTEKIHDRPYSLVLLDEFEKAHTTIQDLFLQVLEDGRLTDNKGRTVSFTSAVIIATSNAASEFIREHVASGEQIDKAFHQKLLEFLQTRAIFKPELLNRFDEIITFTPLTDLEIRQIVKLLLGKLIATLKEQDIDLSIRDDIIDKIAREGYDKQFGARPLRRFIQNNLEDQIAKLKLEDRLKRGMRAVVRVNEKGDIAIEPL